MVCNSFVILKMRILTCFCPKILRVDKGTENVSLASAHVSLRLQHIDEFSGEKSFIYGPSKHNIVCIMQKLFKIIKFNRGLSHGGLSYGKPKQTGG